MDNLNPSNRYSKSEDDETEPQLSSTSPPLPSKKKKNQNKLPSVLKNEDEPEKILSLKESVNELNEIYMKSLLSAGKAPREESLAKDVEKMNIEPESFGFGMAPPKLTGFDMSSIRTPFPKTRRRLGFTDEAEDGVDSRFDSPFLSSSSNVGRKGKFFQNKDGDDYSDPVIEPFVDEIKVNKTSEGREHLLDVIFSFDTTGSMSPVIKSVRKNLTDTVDRLYAELPGIRIGILVHGDYSDYPFLCWKLDLCGKDDIQR